MSAKPDTAVYFALVQALPDGSAVLAAHLIMEAANPTQTLLVHLQDDRWTLVGRVYEAAAALCRDPDDSTAILVLGREGSVGRISIPKRQFAPLTPPPEVVVGYYEHLAAGSGMVAICGVDHVVQILQDRRWRTIRALPRVDATVPPSDFLLHVDIGDGPEVVVCGSKGFLGFWTDDEWESVETGTNIDLNAVLQRDRGEVLVCGGGGMLLRVRERHQIQVVAEAAFPDVIFWDLEQFGDRVFIAAGAAGLFTLIDNELIAVELPFPETAEVYRVSAAGDALWATGDEFVYRFDGVRWTRHLSPANR